MICKWDAADVRARADEEHQKAKNTMPKNFFDEKVIMKDIKKTNTVFIYPRGMGKGIIIRDITENGNVDTEIIGNKSRTKLLSGRIIEEEKFEDKYIIRHYNERGELEFSLS